MDTIITQHDRKEEFHSSTLLSRFQAPDQMDIWDVIDAEVDDDFIRLQYCFDGVDISSLLHKLNVARHKGRNDYPNEVMLKLILAKSVVQHNSDASFIRELQRNAGLRKFCGLKDGEHLCGKRHKVPPPRVFTNFRKRLLKYKDELDSMTESLVAYMYEHVEGFGENVCGDGKYIQSYATQQSDDLEIDGRKEQDACVSIKENYVIGSDGKENIKKHSFFGFRTHVIVDALTGLPIKVITTKANVGEREVMKDMLQEIRIAKYVMLDKGYDSEDMLETIREVGSIPIVDIRNMRKDEDGTQYRDTTIYYYEKTL